MTYAVIEYGDFQIHLDLKGTENAELKNEFQKVLLESERKKKLFENGILSKKVYKELTEKLNEDTAKLYSKYVVVGWKGKFKEKDLPEFTSEACAELLAKKENVVLFYDIVQEATNLAVKQNELDDEEIKN